VDASSVSSTSSALVILAPLTVTGVWAGACQYRHGAVNHTLNQVKSGAARLSRRASRLHLGQLGGHGASVHWTALNAA